MLKKSMLRSVMTLAMAICLLLTTACSGSGSGAAQSSGAAGGKEEQIELTFGTPLYVEAPHKAAFDKLSARYTELNPNIKITMYGTEDGTYFDNLTTEILGGAEGDMFQIYPENVARYYVLRPEGVFLNLDDFITPEMEENLVGQENCKYEDSNVCISNYAWGTTGIFYWKSIFAENNIDASSIRTLDDMRAVAKKLTSGENAGFGIESATDYFGHSEWTRLVSRVVASGQYFPNEQPPYTGDNLIFNSDANVWAAEWWHSFMQPGEGAKSYIGKKEVREAFWNKNLAMNFDGPWFIGMCEERDPAILDDIGLIPQPVVEYNGQEYKPNPSLYPYYSCISAKTQHPDECKAFLKWMTSDEAQAIIADCGMIPVSKSYVNDSDYKETHALAYTFANFLENNYTTPVSDPAISQQGELQQVLVDVCVKVFNENADAKTEFDKGAAKMAEILSRTA